MGTRSLTFVYDSTGDNGESEPIMCVYRQFDGYPSGHGHELAQFLDSKTLVNGFGGVDLEVEANGMSCLAAQLVVQLKHGVGGIYIYAPVLGRDYGQDYEYHVYEDKVIVYHDFPYEGNRYDQEPLFEGTWEEFRQFCLDPISAE
jgi:hypothetical protein